MKTMLGFHPLPQTGVRPKRVFLVRPAIPSPRYAPRWNPAPGFVPQATAALLVCYALAFSVIASVWL